MEEKVWNVCLNNIQPNKDALGQTVGRHVFLP